MTDFTKTLPQWDKVGVEPPSSKKTVGWQSDERPPADYMNWFQNQTYQALKELQDNATHKQEFDDFKDTTTVQLAERATNLVYLESFKRETGETDDTGRFQRAIDSFTGDFAGTIIIPKKIYISGQITINKTGLVLKGVGNKISKIISTYSGIALFVKPLYGGTPYRNTGYCKFYMDNVAIQAEGSAITTGTGLYLQWVYASSFHNLYTSGFAKHIVLQGSHLNTFFNLYQENADDTDQGIEIHNRGIGLSAVNDPDEGSSNNNNVIGGWIHNCHWDLTNLQLTKVRGIDIEPASNSFILGYANTFTECRFERMDYYATNDTPQYPRFPWFVLNGDRNTFKDNIYGASGANNDVNSNPIFQVNGNYNEIEVPDDLNYNIGLLAFGPNASGNTIYYNADMLNDSTYASKSSHMQEYTSVLYNNLKNRIIYKDKKAGTITDIVGSNTKAQGEFTNRVCYNNNIINNGNWYAEQLTSAPVDIPLPIGRTVGSTTFTKLTVNTAIGNRRYYPAIATALNAPADGIYTLTATVYIPSTTSVDLSIGVYLNNSTFIKARDKWVTVRSRAFLKAGDSIVPTFQLYGAIGDVAYIGEISVCDGNNAVFISNNTNAPVSASF